MGNEDDEDAEFDALFSETKTPPTSSSKPKKRVKSGDGTEDEATPKAKKVKTPSKKDAAVVKSEEELDDNLSTGEDDTPNHVNNRKSASSAVSSFLDRPYLNRPPPSSPTLIDMSSASKVLADKDIQPSSLKFGFLGLGIMGTGCVKKSPQFRP